ncbi:proteoglycan 4-like [Schistocerca nitens]|uniref:proteoglycan 4-like n=1 Tax=Schistocerca nitens TaxID=7011 RepID=UPI00211962E2|nr:proteoglycan 4-like [Schistocerca nitens]
MDFEKESRKRKKNETPPAAPTSEDKPVGIHKRAKGTTDSEGFTRAPRTAPPRRITTADPPPLSNVFQVLDTSEQTSSNTPPAANAPSKSRKPPPITIKYDKPYIELHEAIQEITNEPIRFKQQGKGTPLPTLQPTTDGTSVPSQRQSEPQQQQPPPPPPGRQPPAAVTTARQTAAVTTARQTAAVTTARQTAAVTTARQTAAVTTARQTAAVTTARQTAAVTEATKDTPTTTRATAAITTPMAAPPSTLSDKDNNAIKDQASQTNASRTAIMRRRPSLAVRRRWTPNKPAHPAPTTATNHCNQPDDPGQRSRVPGGCASGNDNRNGGHCEIHPAADKRCNSSCHAGTPTDQPKEPTWVLGHMD